MTKSSLLALLGLAAALTLASPAKANAGVVIGVGVAPACRRPAFGYVVVHPRPYAYGPHPYAYPPAYVYPAWGYYGGFHPATRWYRRGFAYRAYIGPRGFRW
jgi:hypothetical protein